MPEQTRAAQDWSRLTCKKHPEGRIHWEHMPDELSSGAKMVLETPYCTDGERPHGFRVPWMSALRDALEDLTLPSDLQIEVKRKPTANSCLPPGVYELEAGIIRKLYLPAPTQAAIQRMRRRIEYAPSAYSKYDLASITDLRLNAIFFGPPGTGKSSAFLDVTAGLIQQRLSVSLRGLVGGHLGDTERNLMELTSFVSQYSKIPGRIALLLDDADDFCSTRGDDSSAAGQTLNALKVGMLHLMDIAQDVPIILTTNRLASLDSAIHRRIVEHIEFPLPDEAARTGIISCFFENLGIPETSLTKGELAELVSASLGFSPAELALAVVDGVCEIESGKGILFCDAIQNSIRARNDMRARAVPAVERQAPRAVLRPRSTGDSEKI